MKRICAWCGRELGEKGNPQASLPTHGICQQCKAKYLEELEKIKRKETKK